MVSISDQVEQAQSAGVRSRLLTVFPARDTLKASHVLTAEQYRQLAAKTRRLMVGRTAEDMILLEAFAIECEEAADDRDRTQGITGPDQTP